LMKHILETTAAHPYIATPDFLRTKQMWWLWEESRNPGEKYGPFICCEDYIMSDSDFWEKFGESSQHSKADVCCERRAERAAWYSPHLLSTPWRANIEFLNRHSAIPSTDIVFFWGNNIRSCRIEDENMYDENSELYTPP
jgi:hypothetical protein